MIVMAVALINSGCPTNDLNAGIGIAGTLLQGATISNDQLASKAKLSAQAMDKRYKVAPNNNKYAQRLNRLTKNLRTYDGLNLNYKVYVSKQINAFAMPDGTVRVYTGLMDIMNDDELVAVIGHEIGHVKYQHSLNQYKKAYVARAARQGLTAFGGDKVSALASSYGNIGEAFLSAQFSQKDELQSDAFGVKLLKSVGRDPYAAASAQKKLQAKGGGGGGFFSSHPASSERIQKATAAADAITKT